MNKRDFITAYVIAAITSAHSKEVNLPYIVKDAVKAYNLIEDETK